MTPLVSSYHTGVDGTKESATQQKLNACLISLQNLVEDWKPDETEQDYVDIELKPTLYYFGLTHTFEGISPKEETPIICNVGSLSLNVGKIDNKGIFIGTMKGETKQNVSDYTYISLQTTDIESETQPHDSSSHTDEPYNKTEKTDDGAVITDAGTRSRYTDIHYYNVHWDYVEEVWRARRQISRYWLTSYERTVDLTKWNISFTRRLKK